MSKIVVRPTTPRDLATIHEINEASVPHVNSVPVRFLDAFLTHAAYFKVATLEDRVAGFLIGLAPDTQYDSLNFLWFSEHYDSFIYVDRIATADWAKRKGVASTLYTDIIDFTKPRAPVLTCEVNLKPANPGSIAFHEVFGFKQVGIQDTEGGAKTVSLMVRDM